MSGVVLGIKFTADQAELQRAADKGVEAIKRTGDAAKRSNDESRRSAQQYTDTLRRQADTLGMSRSQVLAYEAAQHKLTDAQRQSAQASISQIDAHEKNTAMLGRVRLAAAAAGAAIGAALVASLKASVTAAAESEQAQLRLEAVLRGTGFAAGFTGDQLDRMASKMQSRLGINDETIKKSMATLLTFKQVGRESFEDALGIAADIAAVMGTDLQSATLQLGKALEDPEQGLTALTRSGISFTGAQKDMIKAMVETGRQAEAITAILRIMKEQGLNGVAEAMNTGVTGAGNDLKNSWDDLLETFGKTPAITQFITTGLRGLATTLRDFQTIADEGNGGLDDGLAFLPGFRGRRAAELRALKAERQAQNARELSRGGAGQVIADAEDGKRVQAAQEKVGTFLAQFKSDNDKLADEIRKFRALAASAGLSAADAAAGEAKIVAKFAKKGSTDGAELIGSLREQLAQLEGEGSAYEKTLRLLEDSNKKFTAAERETIKALAQKIQTLGDARTANAAHVKSAEAMVRQWEQEDDVLARLNESLSLQAQGLQLETEMMFATDAQREKAIALRELDNKFRRETVNLQGEELEKAQQLFDRERQRIGDLLDQRGAAQERKKANETAKAEQKRFEDELARGLTDSIFRGFEGGKSFARNFWDSMKNMAKSTILQPVVKFLVSPITGSIGGVLGGMGIPGMANASTGGGNFFNQGMSQLLDPKIFSSGGGISGAAGMLTGGFDSIFQGAGVSMGSQFVADIGNYGLGMPVIGGALQMLTGNVKGGAGTMIGGAIGSMFGPIGTVVGSTLGGLVGSAFGGSKGGPASSTGYEVSGQVSRSGFAGDWYHTSRNSKEGFRWAQAPDIYGPGSASQVYGAFNDVVSGAYSAIEGLGKALGLDTGRLNDSTATLSLSGIGKPGEGLQEMTAAFAGAMGSVTDQLALELMPNLREFAQANETLTQTLMRLAEARRVADLNKIFGSMQGALQLADQTRDLWLSNLSPLTARQRLDEASGRYGETLAAAQSGDLGAMGQLSASARTYLGEARSFYASSADYTGIFGAVQAQIGNLVEDTLVEQSIAFSEMGIPLEQISANTKDLDKRIAAALEAAIAARGAADDAAMRAQTEALVRANEDLARTLQSFLDARVLT